MLTEVTGQEGPAPDGIIPIIASRYNESICDALVEGSIKSLKEAGVSEDRIRVIRVPGAWELPLAAATAMGQSETVGVITLGCVIKGETTHDEHINRSVSDALMKMSVETRKPIGFGLLTCNTLEQALQRSGGTVGNKGEEAAEAVLEMLRLGQKLL
ncbi:MAG: 6,7-dimethyl-8-ribityllumazine synthase [Planctomycetota bacterium]